MGLVSIQQHFADVGRASFRSDGPHDIGQILRPVLGRRLELLHLRIDFDNTLLALHLGFAARLWHQSRAVETDVRGSAAVMVIDRFGCSRNHGDAIDRHRRAIISGRNRLLHRVRSLGRLGRQQSTKS